MVFYVFIFIQYMIDHQDLTVYFILKKIICNTKRKEIILIILI